MRCALLRRHGRFSFRFLSRYHRNTPLQSTWMGKNKTLTHATQKKRRQKVKEKKPNRLKEILSAVCADDQQTWMLM